MKTLITFFLLIVAYTVMAQNLTQVNFEGVIVPQYMASGNTTRLPIVYRATLTNLTPNTTYRFFNQMALRSDIGTTNPGAGNPMFIQPDSLNYRYTTSTSLTTAGGYGTFITNASGSFTGWFAVVNTGNARFTPGNYVIPSIVIGDNAGVLLERRALNDSIRVLGFRTDATDTSGTGIWGKSLALPKNIILLYNETAGTSKPLTTTYVEDEGVTVASTVAFYTDSVNGRTGRWGAIIPNLNTNGVRRFEQRSRGNANIIAFNTNNVGLWGSTSTVNPNGGATNPLIIDSLSASIPVELNSFSANVSGKDVILSWTTASELNNNGFYVERKAVNEDFFRQITFVKGNGTSSELNHYNFVDKNLESGTYNYRLVQIDFDGTQKIYNLSQEVNIGTPTEFKLLQNYPNPFNPSTTIEFTLSKAGNYKVRVFDLTGQEISLLADGYFQAGSHLVRFDGNGLSSGIYITILEGEGNFSRILMTLLK